MRFDCIIFDCDGTLIDSEPLGHIAMAEELALLGIAEDAAAMETRYRAWRLRALLDDLERRYATRLDAGLETRWRARLAALYDSGLRAFDGADAMLAALPQAKCVASNGPRHKIEHGLHNGGLLHHFGDRLYSAYEVQAWKPDPTLFLHAARQMGAAPVRCAVVEDSPIGIAAAQAAGMAAFLFDPQGREADQPGVVRFAHLGELPGLLAHPDISSEACPA